MTPLIKLVRQQIVSRAALKAAGEYAKADALRDNLRELGFLLEDDKNGTMVSIPGTDFSDYVETNLKYLVKRVKTNV